MTQPQATRHPRDVSAPATRPPGDSETTAPAASLPDERGAAGEPPAAGRTASSSAAQDETDTQDEAGAQNGPDAPKSLSDNAAALTHIDGLVEEVAILRAAIQHLARSEIKPAERVKVLAELRHQVEALCTALKTQQVLATGGDVWAAKLAQALDDLGDQLGVPPLAAHPAEATGLGRRDAR